VAVLSPALAGLSEARQQLFLFTLTLIDRFRGDGLDAANDADAASAAGALAGTFEAASKGIIYEQRADSMPAQRMAEGIKGMFDQVGRGRPSGFAADAAAVLRELEDRIRAVQRATPGETRAFLALAERVSRRLGGPGAEAMPAQGGPPPMQGGAGRGIIRVCVPTGSADCMGPGTPGDPLWLNAVRFVTRARSWAAR
jgi:hypothetical protein